MLVKGKKHLTKKEIEDRKKSEVKAKSDKIEPPPYLSTKKLKNKFNEIAQELIDINIMSNLDIDALGRFVFHQSEWERISRVIRKTDPIDPEYDSLLNKLDKHFKSCRQSSMDLGLTISSRCKLEVPQKEEEKEESKFEKQFGNV